jgi:hypothetical protein
LATSPDGRFSALILPIWTSALGRQRYDQDVRYLAAYGHELPLATVSFRASKFRAISDVSARATLSEPATG